MATRRGIRKIENGSVRFFGKTYRPADPNFAYNGELDGQKWFFIAYEPLEHQKMIGMWGSERLCSALKKSDEEYERVAGLEDNLTPEDRFVRWSFWKQV